MSWNTGLLQALFNSCIVGVGTSLVATAMAIALTLAIGWYRVPGHRWLGAAVLCLVLVPPYVQATAWSAGFGNEGWMRLSQVAASINPWKGIASVVWIHSVTLVPSCFLITLVGLRRSCDEQCALVVREFGRAQALKTILARRMIPWIGASMFWSFCMTNNDMVVTNLFQVPTLTESVYQQVQFNELRAGPIACSILSSLVIGGLGVVLIFNTKDSASTDRGSNRTWTDAGCNDRSWSARWSLVVAAGIFFLVVCVPVACLMERAAIRIIEVDGHSQRVISAERMVQSVLQSVSYREEILWSVSLAGSASLLSLMIAVVGLRVSHGRWSIALVAGVLGCALALPGPIINLSIGWLMNRPSPMWIGFLADRTLCAPILALQFRTLPLIWWMLWIVRCQFETRFADALRLDRGLSPWTRGIIRLRFMAGPIGIGLMIGFFVAFADLSTYLLVNPPGVRTVAMAMFEQLHYGVRNKESGLALLLIAVSALPGIWVVRRYGPGAR